MSTIGPAVPGPPAGANGDLEALAHDWVAAISRRDFDRLEGLLDPEVRFRALIPRGLREAGDPIGAVAWLRDWFGAADVYAMRSTDIALVGDRVRVTYRVDVHEDGEWLTVEQTMVGTGGTRGFARVDILCSGFRPIPAPSDLVVE